VTGAKIEPLPERDTERCHYASGLFYERRDHKRRENPLVTQRSMNPIIIENALFRLTVGSDCIVQSLILKETGEECLQQGEDIALFSVTQPRPYNNEVKLSHPNKRTIFQANRIRREGNELIIGFEITPFEAVVEIKEAPMYVAFKLARFIVHETDYPFLSMTPPPVIEFRLVQLPVKNRARFGEWLNVSWDESAAVNVLATSPYARIDSERRKGYRIMSADAVKGIKLESCEAALIVSKTESFMDAVASLEEDYDLPRGVESRRSKKINSSIYWSGDVIPENVDEHIAYAKKGGFRNMCLYDCSIFAVERGYADLGDYKYRKEYPNGAADLKKMLDKIKAAGITPGLHILHTHIGKYSSYVTPVADSRLHLTKHFTLAKPLGMDDTVVYVHQNPEGTVMFPECRVLMFGGELIQYESYETEPPYCFKGCVRGHWNTNVKEHAMGTIGGILDVSEYVAISVYLDQETDLQEEIADKIADAYNAGCEFIYFDGSEGTNAPFEFHVPNAQYRVYKKLKPAPLFCEGAAKAHFSWHMLSGGNAFDIFPAETFKKMIAKHPAEEAPRMQSDFTRLDFGWWTYYEDMQPDMYEYATSRGAAWDCPGTIQSNREKFRASARTDDNLEVIRRWEEVRASNWLTAEQKEELKNLDQEHTLLINEAGEFELVRCTELELAEKEVAAFLFERKGKRYLSCWHKHGSGSWKLPLQAQIAYEKELGGEQIPVTVEDGGYVLPLDGRAYVSTDATAEALIEAVRGSTLL